MEADRPALTQIRFLAPLMRLGAIHVQAAEQDTSQKTSGGDWPGREDSAGKLTTVKDRTANRAYFMSHRNVWARVRRITFHVRRGGGAQVVTVRLNRTAFEHAKKLIATGRFVFDERGAWSDHRPTTEQENEFIDQHGYSEYGKWHLGIDDEWGEHAKARYGFPYGDFEKVHRCGVLSAESRAGQHKDIDIENAAAHLHGMIDAMGQSGRRSA